jgi:hypothetical protein
LKSCCRELQQLQEMYSDDGTMVVTVRMMMIVAMALGGMRSTGSSLFTLEGGESRKQGKVVPSEGVRE